MNYCNQIELKDYVEKQRVIWTQKIFSTFLTDESSLSDSELVYVYNQVVYLNDPAFAGEQFKKVLCKEFSRRTITQSQIFGNYKKFFNETLVLKGKELLPIIWLSKQEVNRILLLFLNLHGGYDSWYNATVIEYDNDKVVFGKKKVMGRINIKVDYLLSSLPPFFNLERIDN